MPMVMSWGLLLRPVSRQHKLSSPGPQASLCFLPMNCFHSLCSLGLSSKTESSDLQPHPGGGRQRSGFLKIVQLRGVWALVTDRPSFLALPLTSYLTLGLTEFLSASKHGGDYYICPVKPHPNRSFHNAGSGLDLCCQIQ